MAMDELVMDDMEIPSAASTAGEEALANKFEQPVEACEHCMGHSGPSNTPVSLVRVPDQSKKHFGPVPLPALRFLDRPAMTLAQNGPPGEHAPPGIQVPRHVLISLFLI